MKEKPICQFFSQMSCKVSKQNFYAKQAQKKRKILATKFEPFLGSKFSFFSVNFLIFKWSKEFEISQKNSGKTTVITLIGIVVIFSLRNPISNLSKSY
jgi:hypothetical protein